MAPPCGSERRWMRAVKMTMCLFFLIPMLSTGIRNNNTIFDKKQKLEIQQQLKRLNKPALKTIESPDGDIIDCVDIKKQPAFDHPLLKNHTIQLRPRSYPKGLLFNERDNVSSNSMPEITQPWHLNGRCPKGTIPIRRTKEEDLLRASSIANFGRKKYKSFPNDDKTIPNYDNIRDHEYATIVAEGDMFYGMHAEINVWTSLVQEPNEFSSSQLWMEADDSNGETTEIIEAGLMVSPKLFDDYNLRLFAYWTRDAYQSTGCYNLNCPGFVQLETEIALGARIMLTSEYAGVQRSVHFYIYKDYEEGHWWLHVENRYLLGYWPSNLFSFMSNSATRVIWGGEVTNKKVGGQHTTTQMGSGRFAEEGPYRASFFKKLQVMGSNKLLGEPQISRRIVTFPNCYNLFRESDLFYYGGPGRNIDCP